MYSGSAGKGGDVDVPNGTVAESKGNCAMQLFETVKLCV